NNDGANPHVYDVNGDGFPDLIYRSGSLWYVALGSAAGYGTPFSTGVAYGNALFGDLLANGKTGILQVNGTNWYYYTFNGSGVAFIQTDTTLVYDSTHDQYILADVDGDGRPDLISGMIRSGTSILSVFTRLNTSTTLPRFSTTQSGSYGQSG